MADRRDRPVKRMRLGTRSCAECRRRKVRCIFPENQQSCVECKAHNSTCISQQAHLEQEAGDEASAGSDVHKRLETLEHLFSKVYKSLEANGDLPSQDGRRVSMTELLNAATTPSLTTNEHTTENDIDSEAGESGVNTPASQPMILDGPLLKLFKEALIIEPQNTSATSVACNDSERVSMSSRRLQSILPNKRLLEGILRASEPYWFLWPVQPGAGNSRVTDACELVLQYLKSRRAVLFVKALLWLTLAVQQLVGEDRRLITSFQATQSALVETYFSEAVDALPHDLSSCDLRDGLECLLLQYKVFINLGRPQKAWRSARSAMDTALLCGLDQVNSSDGHGRALFQMSWQFERKLCTILNLPFSISEHDPGLLASRYPDSLFYRVTREISVIAGHLVERNRAGYFTDYANTERIEAEIQQLIQSIPLDAYLRQLPRGLPVQQYFEQFQIELYIHFLRKSLHIPFLFSKVQDSRYATSRFMALDSARCVCEAFQSVRKKAPGWLMMCDLADFHVFTGAATLVLSLLNPELGCHDRDDEADWQLVESITAHLRRTHKLVDCAVAGQAAELLEDLSLARQGFLPENETYSVSIPYFGKFRIRRQSARKGEVGSISPSWDEEVALSDTCFNSIEFQPDLPQGLSGLQMPCDMMDNVDIGMDWLTGVEFDPQLNWTWDLV